MKRWVVLRHIRYLWHRYHCYRFAQACAALGLGLGIPNEADLRTLDAIWEGKA